MDRTPPSSADDSYQFCVTFNNVERFYVSGGDVTCCYTLTQNIVPRQRDWVGIFQVGWKATSECCTFTWAPLTSERCGTSSAAQYQVQFKAYYPPKEDENYQFCYINQNNVVLGISKPFQFRAETEEGIMVIYTQKELEERDQQEEKLLKENKELKVSCESLQKQNNGLQEELKKAKELQNSLESNTKNLEKEMDRLKEENKCLKEKEDCKNTELQQLKEQVQNVISDNKLLESRLKIALNDKDQLQSKVSNLGEEVEKLTRMDREKMEQLESLKEENRQLCVTQQVKPSLNIVQQTCNLKKELEEQKQLFKVLQARNSEVDTENQKLRKQNEELQKCLSKDRNISSSAVSQPRAPIPVPDERGLVFGNPYNGEKNLASLRRSSMCDEAFPEEIETSWPEDHMQRYLLRCPLCSEAFKKVFDDHIFCHSLD
ncbi:CACO2 protein, partial [Centropus bengalensis]|nr:CACO2 protein [Centropus bengalensis]